MVGDAKYRVSTGYDNVETRYFASLVSESLRQLKDLRTGNERAVA